jgi:hypothetical protein
VLDRGAGVEDGGAMAAYRAAMLAPGILRAGFLETGIRIGADILMISITDFS